MKDDDLFASYPAPPKTEINYFVLLCELDDTKVKYEKRIKEGSSQSELNYLYKKINKLEKQVNRDGNKLDGIKPQRSKGEAASTIIIKAYLVEHPCGSVATVRKTEQGEVIKTLFQWAKDNEDKEISGCEITEVIYHESITFIDSNTGKENTVKKSTLEKKLSSIKKS